MRAFRARIAWLLWVGIALGTAPIHAQRSGAAREPDQGAGEWDLSIYLEELGRWDRAVEKLKKHPAEIASLRESLPPHWSVVAGDHRFQIPTDWLASALKSWQENPEKGDAIGRDLGRRLRAMQEEAEELHSAGSVAPLEPARAELARVFERREFRAMRGPSWLDRVREKIGLWLERQLARLLSRIRLGATFGNFFIWIVIALAFLALIWILRDSLSRSSGPPVVEFGSFPAVGGVRNWLNEATSSAGRGDYREAVHCAYWAGVVRLEEMGVLVPDRSRTPREALRLLRGEPQRAPLENLTWCLERVWYGFRPASPSDWDEAAMQLERMGCQVRSMPATANS